MGYHVIDPDDVERMPDRDAEARSISDAAGLSVVGLRVYHAAPGEQIPLSYHYHDEQEEVFFVRSGELRVETPDGEFVVPTGSFFVAEPGSPHRAYNAQEAGTDLSVVAIGAPSVDDAHGYEP